MEKAQSKLSDTNLSGLELDSTAKRNIAISLGNIDGLSLREGALTDIRCAHIKEIADSIIDSASDTDSVIRESRELSLVLNIKDGRKTHKNGKHKLRDHAFFDRLLAYSYIADRLREKKERPTIDSFCELISPPSHNARGKVAYVRNTYSDEAYLKFVDTYFGKEGMEEPRAQYFGSFTDICEEVFNSLCEYCILPIESSGEGLLTGFWSLASKYGLKIVSDCVLPLKEENSTMRFALLSRSLCPESSDIQSLSQGHEIDISVGTQDGQNVFSSIAIAADMCGIEVSGIFSGLSLTPIDSGEKHSCLIKLQCTGGDLLTFLIYLSCEIPEFDLVGIFKKQDSQIK